MSDPKTMIPEDHEAQIRSVVGLQFDEKIPQTIYDTYMQFKYGHDRLGSAVVGQATIILIVMLANANNRIKELRGMIDGDQAVVSPLQVKPEVAMVAPVPVPQSAPQPVHQPTSQRIPSQPVQIQPLQQQPPAWNQQPDPAYVPVAPPPQLQAPIGREAVADDGFVDTGAFSDNPTPAQQAAAAIPLNPIPAPPQAPPPSIHQPNMNGAGIWGQLGAGARVIAKSVSNNESYNGAFLGIDPADGSKLMIAIDNDDVQMRSIRSNQVELAM